MRASAVAAAFLILIGALAWLAVPLPSGWSYVGLWPFTRGVSLDPRLLPLIGVPLGLGLGVLFGDLWFRVPPDEHPLRRRERHSSAVVLLTLLFSGALLLAAVLNEAVKPLSGALVLLCGTAALLTLIVALRGIADDRPVELRSHWGGLGGSQGGWRISGTAVALLLTLVLISTTVAVGLTRDSDQNQSDNGLTETNESANELAAGNPEPKNLIGAEPQAQNGAAPAAPPTAPVQANHADVTVNGIR